MSYLWARQQQVGEARQTDDEQAKDTSLSAMYSTFVPVFITAVVLFLIFAFLRRKHSRYYAPRTYLGSLREQERTPPLPTGMFNWIGEFWKMPDIHALQSQSLDAYFFIRFLRVCATICLVGLLMTWPILFPIHATGGKGLENLAILTMGNIDETKPSGLNRFYAHAFIAWLFYGFVGYTVVRECIFYINMRQAFLLSPLHANRISNRTVLFTSVPEYYLDESRIRKLFSDSVKNVWIVADTKDLDDLVEERDKVAYKLESAEVKLIKAVNKERLKKTLKKDAPAREESMATHAEPGHAAARWIDQKKRPTHRLGKFGLWGKKVDSIEWGRSELQRLIPQVDAAQGEFRAGKGEKIGAFFVEFYTQSDAQAANQVLTHHQALQMTPSFIGIQPSEVIWKSLGISWWQKIVRRYAVVAFITVMILFWTVPVAFVALISQISFLTKTFTWLEWLNDIPDAIFGVISGLLPSVALAILMSLVPIVMRMCARFAGEPSLARVELFTQNAYFAFQLIQVFLITTLSASAVDTARAIADNPGSVFTTLSEALPKGSSFYVTYFIVQGLGIAAKTLSQVAGFAIFTLLYKFLSPTPRAMYRKWSTLATISWGSVLPIYTNITVISITYTVIAPLMLFWSTLGIGLFYIAYRYQILYVTDTNINTHGLIYPRALKQLLCGVYLAEICLIGMFIVNKAFGPLVIVAVLLVVSVLVHLTVQSAINPLLYHLPRTLQLEEEALLQRNDLEAAATGGSGYTANGVDSANGRSTKKDAMMKFVPGGRDNLAEKPGNPVMRWLKPWHFADYQTLRRLVPGDFVDVNQLYSPEVETEAYMQPSIASRVPLLWIPEDEAGVSKDEIMQTSKVIPITDEGCTLNEKNKIIWDAEGARPPIWDEKVYY